MKYIIEYSLSFGSKVCETCSGTGMITIITADSYVRRPCSNNDCFHDGSCYTAPRDIFRGIRKFTSEHALNHFCKKLYKLKMQLAFHNAGLHYSSLRDVYYPNPAACANKFAKSLTSAGTEASRLLPYHNKLSVSIYRKP